MTRPTIASLALLIMLGFVPAGALAQQPEEDKMPVAKVEDKGSPVAAYILTGVFAAGAVFAVCKSALRSTAP